VRALAPLFNGVSLSPNSTFESHSKTPTRSRGPAATKRICVNSERAGRFQGREKKRRTAVSRCRRNQFRRGRRLQIWGAARAAAISASSAALGAIERTRLCVLDSRKKNFSRESLRGCLRKRKKTRQGLPCVVAKLQASGLAQAKIEKGSWRNDAIAATHRGRSFLQAFGPLDRRQQAGAVSEARRRKGTMRLTPSPWAFFKERHSKEFKNFTNERSSVRPPKGG